MSIALGSFHIVRSRARERLRLSCGIRGNGWCVTHDLLARVPYHAYSLTEDIEYGVALGLQGERVHYADEGHVYGEMVTNSRSAASQRQRWEQGRFKLIRQHALALFRAAAGQSSRVCLDLGFDLLVLPLSYIALNIVALAVLAGLSAFVDAHLLQWLWVAAACAACVACYVLRGWWVSGVGWRGLPDLLWAPVFIVWKIFLAVAGSRATEWLRTERERP
jgi:cellulose synthase/poly-beta-1,6-N-acetylglucosamine synthase-like glycosyltransferase